MTQPNQSELKCGHTAPDWNGEGDCITCARDKLLGNKSELDSQSTRNRVDKSELERQVHKLFGDNQGYDGGYQSCYDGKWIDMTNEVVSVADYITANYTQKNVTSEKNYVTSTSDKSGKLCNIPPEQDLTLDEVAEREQSLWAITYDFLHGVDRGLCDEWERVIAELTKAKDQPDER